MNKFQRGVLELVVESLEDLEENFASMPEVWVGIGRPQHRLTTNQRLVAKVGVTVVRVVLETILERD